MVEQIFGAKRPKLSRVSGQGLLVVGILLVVADLVYLPKQAMFDSLGLANMGLVMYSLATAGGAFAAWGYILLKMTEGGTTRQQVFMGTAIGLFLMGIMRIETFFFPPPHLDQALAVLIGEGLAFILLAVVFVRFSR